MTYLSNDMQKNEVLASAHLDIKAICNHPDRIQEFDDFSRQMSQAPASTTSTGDKEIQKKYAYFKEVNSNGFPQSVADIASYMSDCINELTAIPNCTPIYCKEFAKARANYDARFMSLSDSSEKEKLLQDIADEIKASNDSVASNANSINRAISTAYLLGWMAGQSKANMAKDLAEKSCISVDYLDTSGTSDADVIGNIYSTVIACQEVVSGIVIEFKSYIESKNAPIQL
jgi:hypothetical protein